MDSSQSNMNSSGSLKVEDGVNGNQEDLAEEIREVVN